MLRVFRLTAAVSLFALLAAGCSLSTPQGQVADPVSEDLTDVAGLLRDYAVEYQRGPTKLTDLAKNQALYSRGYQAIKTGNIVVVWGVRMPLQGQGGGTGIIAYEKKVETEGGAVLLENGDIKKMTAAEFTAAPKAK